jgi:catechol 2,3-dioxygenase-like lactoylglutathione lyase family enzyme
MTVMRIGNVGIVVEDIDAAVEFFTELGLSVEGRMPIVGEWAGRVTGVRGQRVARATVLEEFLAPMGLTQQHPGPDARARGPRIVRGRMPDSAYSALHSRAAMRVTRSSRPAGRSG